MRVLLVGGGSTVARALLPRLEEFAEVTTAGRTGCDIHLDLAEEVELEPGFDVVVNTAAHLGTGDDPMVEAARVNVTGLLRLCAASTAAAVGRLVHVSSIFAELPPDSPHASPYSLSKRHGDEWARLYSRRHALPLAILRPAQIYGVGEAYRRGQPFLYSLMDRAQAGQDITLYGSHDALRNFIHVDDVTRAIALTVRLGLEGTYQCAYPEDVRYSEVARAAIDAFGSSSTVRFDPQLPDTPDNVFAPDHSLYSAIGFTPAISLAEGMRREARHRLDSEHGGGAR